MSFLNCWFFSFSPKRVTSIPSVLTSSNKGLISFSTSTDVVFFLSIFANTDLTVLPSLFSIFSYALSFLISTMSVSLTTDPEGVGIINPVKVVSESLLIALVLISITPFSLKVIAFLLSRKYPESACAIPTSLKPNCSP